MSKFFELYKRPEWQEKRLRIMERDGFACIRCGNKSQTLHVHHGYYAKDRAPWEYEDETLHTLCDQCYKDVSDRIAVLRLRLGVITDYFDEIIGFISAVRCDMSPEFQFELENHEQACGVAAYFKITPKEVISLADSQSCIVSGSRLLNYVKERKINHRSL